MHNNQTRLAHPGRSIIYYRWSQVLAHTLKHTGNRTISTHMHKLLTHTIKHTEPRTISTHMHKYIQEDTGTPNLFSFLDQLHFASIGQGVRTLNHLFKDIMHMNITKGLLYRAG